jgi:hypothetical protein
MDAPDGDVALEGRAGPVRGSDSMLCRDLFIESKYYSVDDVSSSREKGSSRSKCTMDAKGASGDV